MSLFLKTVIFVVYAAVTGLVSGGIGNAMGNPSDAAGAWFLFLIVGGVVLAILPRRLASVRA
jgi:hypothetical protein